MDVPRRRQGDEIPVGQGGDVALPLRPRHRRAVHEQPGSVSTTIETREKQPPRSRNSQSTTFLCGSLRSPRLFLIVTACDDALSILLDYPAYAGTSALDDLRAAEYGRLDAQRHRLSRLHRRRAPRRVAGPRARRAARPARLRQSALGQSELDGDDRRSSSRRARRVLDYFNGTGEYTAVFTPNASGALKLVGESYPFEPGGRLLLTFDNHNSVNGIREFARAQGRGSRLRAADDARPAHRPGRR